jgi:hypothetical protein
MSVSSQPGAKPRERVRGAHSIRDWVDPKVGLKCLLPLKRIEVLFFCHPDRNLSGCPSLNEVLQLIICNVKVNSAELATPL